MFDSRTVSSSFGKRKTGCNLLNDYGVEGLNLVIYSSICVSRSAGCIYILWFNQACPYRDLPYGSVHYGMFECFFFQKAANENV
jgi:hypothetical protein